MSLSAALPSGLTRHTPYNSNCAWDFAYSCRMDGHILLCERPVGTYWVVHPHHDWSTEPHLQPTLAGPISDFEAAYVTACLLIGA